MNRRLPSICAPWKAAVVAGATYLVGAAIAKTAFDADILGAHAIGFAVAILVLSSLWQGPPEPIGSKSILIPGTLGLAVTAAAIANLDPGATWPTQVTIGIVALLCAAAVFTWKSTAAASNANRTAISVAPILLAVWIAGIVHTASRDINHDTAWFLAAIANWLGGQSLYVGVYEVNPPLIFYLYAPSVLFSQSFGIDETASLIGWVYLLIAGSLAWCYRIADTTLAADRRDWLMLTVTIALVVAPIADFAQREHLMLILAMPYLLILALQPAETDLPRWQRAMAGMIAVCGLALKPHYLAAPALMVIARIVQTRSLMVAFRIENIVFGAGCLAYPLFIVMVHPAYLQNVVPFAAQVYGAGYGAASPLDIATVPEMLAALLLFCLVRLFPPEDKRYRQIGEILAAALAGFALAYLAQGAGWFYHRVPMIAFLGILGGWMFFSLWENHRPSTGAVIAGLIAAAAVIVRPALVADLQFAPPASQLAKAFPADMKGRSMSAFAFNLGVGFPLATRLDARWASRFPCQWLIPGALARRQSGDELTNETRAMVEKALAFTRTATVDDLVRYRPDFVLVDRAGSPDRSGKPFRFLEFFDADPRFAGVWSHYELQQTILGVEIWRRRDGGLHEANS